MLISVGDPKGYGGETQVDPATVVGVYRDPPCYDDHETEILCVACGISVLLHSNLPVRVVSRRINKALEMMGVK